MKLIDISALQIENGKGSGAIYASKCAVFFVLVAGGALGSELDDATGLVANNRSGGAGRR